MHLCCCALLLVSELVLFQPSGFGFVFAPVPRRQWWCVLVNDFTGWLAVSGLTDLVVVLGMLWLGTRLCNLDGQSKVVTRRVPGFAGVLFLG